MKAAMKRINPIAWIAAALGGPNYGSAMAIRPSPYKPRSPVFIDRGPRKSLNHRVIRLKRMRRIRAANGGKLPKKYQRK